MHLQAICVALLCLAPIVSALTLNAPSNLVIGEETTITWTTSSKDEPRWTLFFMGAGDPFDLRQTVGENIDSSIGKITTTFPVDRVKVRETYILKAVNVTMVDFVLANSPTFQLKAHASSTVSVSKTSSTKTSSTKTSSTKTSSTKTSSTKTSVQGTTATGTATDTSTTVLLTTTVGDNGTQTSTQDSQTQSSTQDSQAQTPTSNSTSIAPGATQGSSASKLLPIFFPTSLLALALSVW